MASTSYLQRRLKIGYNKAAGLIDRLEEEGIISAPNHAGKRKCWQLVSHRRTDRDKFGGANWGTPGLPQEAGREFNLKLQPIGYWNIAFVTMFAGLHDIVGLGQDDRLLRKMPS
ncbi:MAG: DNA translocase FtsK [Hyphomonas sp.]